MSDLFLLNLEKIFIYIRYDLERIENRNIILCVINIINEFECDNNELCKQIKSLSLELGKCIILSNKIDIKIANRMVYGQFLIDTLNFFLRLLNDNEYEKSYDVIDILHAVPNVIIVNEKKSKRLFYKTYIKRFSKKWKEHYFDKVKVLFEG